MNAISQPPVFAPAAVRNAVEIEHVTKYFGKLKVLENISFNTPAGSVLAIAGASGCGKSTLLNIIAGLVAADQGTVRVDGAACAPEHDTRVISYMFQEDRLLPWRSILANIEFGLEAGTMSAALRRERAREALRMTGLEAFENAYPHELSGGMRSRVALARSLVVKPYILLMDEPFSKLDPQMRSQMHRELLRLREQLRMTVVFVTHDVEEAIVLADKVVVLEPRPGRVRDVLPINLERPRDPLAQNVAETVRRVRALI